MIDFGLIKSVGRKAGIGNVMLIIVGVRKLTGGAIRFHSRAISVRDVTISSVFGKISRF